MNKSDNSSIFKTSLLVALIGSVFSAHAAGLGKLTVFSAIGQPLNAEVALEATPDELKSLSAKLASQEVFKEAGIDFMPALTRLEMSIARSSGGKPVLRLTTAVPLNEPFMQFLVELNWTSGRMVREYIFLLDPPEMLKVTKPAPVVTPQAPIVKTVPSAPAATRPTPVPSAPAVASTTPDIRESAEDVLVKPGDTLFKIANEHKADSVSLDQMLVALFNGNRDAFINGNMNRLRAGKILKLPDAEAAANIDAGEARKMIVSQARDFNAYRRALAEAAAKAPAEISEPRQQAAGKIKPQVEESAPPAPTKDKLEVSRTEAPKSAGDSAARGRLEEQLIARDKALREASERVAQLEKNLENLKKLAELKSQTGAQMQQQAQADVPAAAPEKQPDESPLAAKPAEPAAESQAVAAKPEMPAPEAEKPAPPPPAKPLPVAKPVAPPPPPKPSFVEENPELVFGGGGLIALLLGYFGFKALRKKKPEAVGGEIIAEPQAPELPWAAKAAEAASVVASAERTEDVSILADFSESSALTTEENVDPVAEADVLLAYGRDVQAEEVLLEGKKKDPSRSAIHAKLLELYSNRKDVKKFESVAQELHELSKGQGPDWNKASTFAGVLGLSGTGLFAADTTQGEEAAVAEPDSIQVAPAIESAGTRHEPAAVENAPPAVAEEAQPTAPTEPASLDFDLDLGTTSMPAEVKAAEAAPARPEAEESAGLDFDFDLGSAGESVPEAEAVPRPVERLAEATAKPADQENILDFDLDLSSTPETVAPVSSLPATEEVAGNEIDFDLDLGGISAQAIETPEAPTPATPESAAIETEAGNEIDFDLDLGQEEPVSIPEIEVAQGLAFEAEAVTPPAPPTPIAPIDLGLEDISLDLDTPEVELPAAGAMPVAANLALPEIELPPSKPEVPLEVPAVDVALETAAAAGTGLESSAQSVVAEVADDPEVATKLELAEAYEEMGDIEGARELLNEVLGQGSAAQSAQAQARLDQLGA